MLLSAKRRAYSCKSIAIEMGGAFRFLRGIWGCISGEIKVSTSTVAALFSKIALTGQRIAMVDMALLAFTSISVSTVGVDGVRVPL